MDCLRHVPSLPNDQSLFHEWSAFLESEDSISSVTDENPKSFPMRFDSTMKRSRQSDSPNSQSTDSDSRNVEDDNAESSVYDDSDDEFKDLDLPGRIKLGLENSRESLSTAMHFASSGPCPIEVNPCIWISGLGVVGLPLSERDANLLSSISHLAPYGGGSDIIVDAAVRQTRELNADQFEMRNPRWQKALEAVVDQVATDLAIPSGPAGINALRHKMLLYGKGDMFKEHRDAEKEPGMFGTLAICLPSEHKGGEAHLAHGGQRKILKTAESSEFGSTYLCWYSHIKHEVMEVTSGFRLVLTYNLVNANAHSLAQAPSSTDAKERKIELALVSWKDCFQKSASESPTLLAYMLEHLYTQKIYLSQDPREVIA